jgi:DNA invertase Pin-like site-specific DNA recombinase
MSENHSTIPGVLYARCSDPRQDASVEQQGAWAQKAAAREGVRLVKVFTDEGIPGDEIDTRPGLQAMLAFLEQQAERGDSVEAMLAWDMDRFSRANSLRTAGQLARMMEAGVCRILTPEGWIDLNNDADLLMQHVKQDFSRAAYSKSISKNVSRSMAQKAARGEFCGSRTPYAYDRGPDDHLVLGDPVKAAAVREIFELYAHSELSLHQIAMRLRAKGVPSPTGRPWQRYAVWDILTREEYTGATVYNGRRRGKYHRIKGGEVKKCNDLAAREAKRRRRNQKTLPSERNAPQDMIIVRDAHPAIIAPELFAKVQRKLAAMKRSTSPFGGVKREREGKPWVLSGLAFCGRCQAVMWGGYKSTRNKGGKQYVYRRMICSSARRYGTRKAGEAGRSGCLTQGVDQAVIVAEAVKLVQEQLLDPQALKALRAEIDRQRDQGDEARAAEVLGLKAKVDELTRQITQGTRNLALAKTERDFARVSAAVSEWEEEREQAQRRLDNLRAAQDAGEGSGDKLEEVLELVGELETVAEEATPEELRAALGQLISRVTVHFEDDGGRAVFSHVDVDLHPDFVNLLGQAGRACARTRGRPR